MFGFQRLLYCAAYLRVRQDVSSLSMFGYHVIILCRLRRLHHSIFVVINPWRGKRSQFIGFQLAIYCEDECSDTLTFWFFYEIGVLEFVSCRKCIGFITIQCLLVVTVGILSLLCTVMYQLETPHNWGSFSS